ncbi:MAG: dehydrogenase, partial [Gordonia sp. (in: high G+C Gram-positive bacteria)]
DGRLTVDECLRSVGDQRIFAAGDAAAVPGARMSCQAALPQGAYVADAIARIARGKEPKPFSMSYVSQNVSLGRRNGVIQVSKRDDTPTRFWYGGRAAATTKETVCKSTVWSARAGVAAAFSGPKK